MERQNPLVKVEKPVDLKGIIEAGKPFRDPDFPPNQTSLGEGYAPYKWQRAHDIFKGQEQVYNTFEPDDVEQGECGNCYLLSSIAALAEFPARVEKLFIVRKANPAGCYAVKLYVQGNPVTVTVDDFFPIGNNGKPAFSGSKGELWVLLLEKAWAKVHGDFKTIEGGDAREAMSALTGAPSYRIVHADYPDKNKLWEEICDYDRRNYIMTTGAKEDVVGIVKAHAYTLMNVFEFMLDHDKVRFVQIRNPWGQTEWTGPWSDNDPRWTPELLKKCNHTKKDDGTFFMDFNDFHRIFMHTLVSKVHDDGIFSHLALDKPSVVAGFVVTTKMYAYVSAYQFSKRIGRTISKSYKTSRLELKLSKCDGNTLIPLKEAISDIVGAAHVEVALEPGLYIVEAQFPSPTGVIQHISVVVYGEKAVDIVEILGVPQTEIPAAARKVFETRKTGFVVKKNMRMIASNFNTCADGHNLVWSVQHGQGERFKCDCCRRECSYEDGRWSCDPCLYDRVRI